MAHEKTTLAKIARPRVGEVLLRKRLFRLMDGSRDKPIVWLSSSPGSGKTTLVASYLDSRGLSCLWYQLDQGDTDPATFFYYMGLAVKKAAPRYRTPLPLLTPEYIMGLSVFTKRYFEELFRRISNFGTRNAKLKSKLQTRNPGSSSSFNPQSAIQNPKSFVVVFDNYQEVPADSRFHEVMREALSVIPDGIRVIVLSRSEPPPALARFTASDEMSAIRWNEIRFTFGETKTFMGRREGPRLSEAVLKQLHETTDGWAAGLMLLAARAEKESNRTAAVGTQPPQEVFDYFAGEVFDKLDSGIREFLLVAAFLPRMMPETAAKLTDNEQAGKILSGLRRNHFFTEQHATTETVYQFHPLFRSFLLTRVKESLSREGILRIQNRAAALLVETGQTEDAVALFLEAGNWESAIRLILGHAKELAAQGRNKTLEAWLNGIPGEIVDATPWLLYWLGVCRVALNPAEGQGHFERALRLFQTQNDTTGTLLAWSGAVNALMVSWDDISRFDSYIQWYYNQKEPVDFPSTEVEAQFASGMANAIVWRQPYHPDIGKWVERALEAGRRSGDPGLRLQACINAAYYYLWTGDVANSLIISDDMRKISVSPGVSPLTLITCKWLEAMIHYAVDADQESGIRALGEALDASTTYGVHVWDHMMYALGVYGSLLKGDRRASAEYLEKMKSTLRPDRSQADCQYHYVAAWHYLAAGDLSAASSHAELALKSAEQIAGTGLYFPEPLCRIAFANILCEQKNYVQASLQLAKAAELAARSRSRMLEFMHHMTKARVELEQGNDAEALSMLRSGLSLGRANNFVTMLFWWQPSVMIKLCTQALEEEIETEYVIRLIRKNDLIPDDPPVIENWPWPIRIYTLGRFELELNGKRVDFGKIQPKPLSMLKALIAFGGKDVSEDRLTDALWPDAEGDIARKSFDTTLHRLRKLIGSDKAILINEGRLTLDNRQVWVDAWAFEKLVENAELPLTPALSPEGRGRKKIPLPRGERMKVRGEENQMLLEKAAALYRGHFLQTDPGFSWAVSVRERLRSKFLDVIVHVGGHWEQKGRFAKATEWLRKGLAIDELAEVFYQHLMVCYQKMGQEAEAVAVYKRCRSMLEESLGIGPSSRTEELYKSLKMKP